MYPSLNLNTLSINPSNSKIGLKITINKNNIGLPIVDFDFCSKKKNAVNNPFKINANDNIPVMFWNKIFPKTVCITSGFHFNKESYYSNHNICIRTF